MRNKDEFKEEVLRRADAAIKQRARTRRKTVQILSVAACFVCVVGILAGIKPLLNLQYDQSAEAMPGEAAESTPYATTQGDNGQESTTPRPSTPAATPAETTPAFSVASSTPGETVPHTTTPVSTEPKTTSTTATSPAEPIVRGEEAYTIQMIPYTSPVLHEDLACIRFDSYDAYKSSPYFVYDTPTSLFDGQSVFLLICPAPEGNPSILIHVDGTDHVLEFSANAATEGGSYCVYLILVDPPEIDVTISLYGN